MQRRGLDFQNYVPALMTRVSNKWSWSSSQLYYKKFGIGINDWRVMTRLADAPGTSANRISVITGLDKALVGRSIKFLEGRGLATTQSDPTDRRSRTVRLTPKGDEVNRQILSIALRREKQLLAGLTPMEVKTLLTLLSRLAENVSGIQAAEARRPKVNKRNARRRD